MYRFLKYKLNHSNNNIRLWQFIYSFKIHTIELDTIVLYDMYVYLFAEVCCTPAVGFCRSSTSPASLTIFDKIIHCRRSSDPPGIQSQPWRQSASVFENDAPRHAAQNVHGAAVAVCELLVWKYEKKYTRRVTRQCWTFQRSFVLNMSYISPSWTRFQILMYRNKHMSLLLHFNWI